MEKLTVKNSEITISEFKENLYDFMKELNEKPREDEVRQNPMANNSFYIPIQIIEDKLNKFFPMMWQTKNFKYHREINEIVGDLELEIFIPHLGTWITRSGTGAVQIQLRSDRNDKNEKIPNDLSDPNILGRKIINTLQKDLPHLKAECIKNAAKSLGRQFGSDLNRKTEDGFLNPNEMESPENVHQEMENINDLKGLMEYYRSLPKVMQRDKGVQAILKGKEIDLKQNGEQ